MTTITAAMAALVAGEGRGRAMAGGSYMWEPYGAPGGDTGCGLLAAWTIDPTHPTWPYNTIRAPLPTESLIDALYQVEAARWDEHHVRAVFELCALVGFRPRSNAPEDIAEAAESIAFKYRRR